MRVSVKVEILINKPTDIPYLYLKNSIFAVTNIYTTSGAGNPASEKLRAFIYACSFPHRRFRTPVGSM